MHVIAGITADKPAPEPGGPTVAEYASMNELGLGVPARPFMAHAYDTDQDRFERFSVNAVRQFVLGNATADQALNAIGLRMTESIQNSIRTAYEWALPNADYTHLKKLARQTEHQADVGPNMGTKPLIDHGIMLNSITFEIRKRRLRPTT